MSVYGGQVASRVAHGPAGGQRGDDGGPVDEVRHSGGARVYPREVDAGGAAGQVAAPPRDLQTRGFWQLSLSTDAGGAGGALLLAGEHEVRPAGRRLGQHAPRAAAVPRAALRHRSPARVPGLRSTNVKVKLLCKLKYVNTILGLQLR